MDALRFRDGHVLRRWNRSQDQFPFSISMWLDMNRPTVGAMRAAKRIELDEEHFGFCHERLARIIQEETGLPQLLTHAIALCERHDEKARLANFRRCGCEDCSPFRAAIAKATEGGRDDR